MTTEKWTVVPYGAQPNKYCWALTNGEHKHLLKGFEEEANALASTLNGLGDRIGELEETLGRRDDMLRDCVAPFENDGKCVAPFENDGIGWPLPRNRGPLWILGWAFRRGIIAHTDSEYRHIVDLIARINKEVG